jgi:hypothetical protein
MELEWDETLTKLKLLNVRLRITIEEEDLIKQIANKY